MTSEIYFDNFIVTSQKEVADRWASDSWGLKKLVASANEVSLVFHWATRALTLGVSRALALGSRSTYRRPSRGFLPS